MTGSSSCRRVTSPTLHPSSVWTIPRSQMRFFGLLMGYHESEGGEQAERFWSEMIGQRPRDGDAYEARARARRERGFFQGSSDDFEMALQLGTLIPHPRGWLRGWGIGVESGKQRAAASTEAEAIKKIAAK